MSNKDYPVLTDIAPDTVMADIDSPFSTSPDGVVLELVERGHRLALALPVFAWPCNVGRAATSDLVLTDASIAAEHVRLHHDGAGHFEVEVLDPTNGVWLGRRHYQKGERFAWAPGQRLTLGRGVQINLRSSAQPLTATQHWRPFSRGQGILTACALVAMAVLATWITWLSATETGELARRLPPMLLWMFGGLLGWVLGWALMSKLFTGTTAFWRHVCIASVGIVVMSVVDQLLSIAGFALSMPLLPRFDSVIAIVMLAVVFWFHLRAATLVSGRTLGVAIGALLVLGAGAKLGLQWQSQKRLGDTLYMSTILPPQWRLAPTVPVDRFMQGTDAIRQQLDSRSKLEKEDDEADDGDDSGLN
ncbi:MAG: FHA domain-containing protein [Comamonas sp.]